MWYQGICQLQQWPRPVQIYQSVHTQYFQKNPFLKGNNDFKDWSIIKKKTKLIEQFPKYRHYYEIELFENWISMKTICINVYLIFHRQISSVKLLKISILTISLTGITAGSR